jgi:hypothetical protein
MNLMSIEQINIALADRLEEWLPHLIGGMQHKQEWIAGSTSEGWIGDSLQVRLVRKTGRPRGAWHHFATGKGGDPLGLYAYVRGVTMYEAVKWAKEYLGGHIPVETGEQRAKREARAKSEAKRAEEDQVKAASKGRWIFFQKSTPLSDDPAKFGPVEHYLTDRRKIPFAKLGHVPGCIRFCPDLWCEQLEANLPAMVAAIVNIKGEQVALHRTWLIEREDGWDRLRDFDAPKRNELGKPIGRDGLPFVGKRVMGSWMGGTIRLWAGNRMNEKTGEIKRGVGWPHVGHGSSIILCEGIETGLSLAVAMKHRRIVATIASAGFASVLLPEAFTDVTLALDRDDDNKVMKRVVANAVETLTAQRRVVRTVYPPEGVGDWNDFINRKGRAA